MRRELRDAPGAMVSIQTIATLVLLVLLASAQSAELDERFLQGREYFTANDYEAAREVWLPLAESGDPQAQFSIAFLYEQGLGVPVDYALAAQWYERAAIQGLAVAQYNLGNAYLHGRGVEASSTLAARLWRFAADQGLAEAQYNLATHQLRGSAAIDFPGEPILLLRSAAASGHADAQDLLASQAFEEVRGALVNATNAGIRLRLDPTLNFPARPSATTISDPADHRPTTVGAADLDTAGSWQSGNLEALGDRFARLAVQSYEHVKTMRTEVKRGIISRAQWAGQSRLSKPQQLRDDPIAALNRWSEAWSSQEVRRYLAQYSSRFAPENGQPPAAWRARREQRITRPDNIKVMIIDPQTREISPDRVAVEFTQVYQSDRYEDWTRKRLEMALEQGRWRIVREQSLPLNLAALLILAPCLVNDGDPARLLQTCPAPRVALHHCREIADRLASVRTDECTHGFSSTGWRSVKGRDLVVKEYPPLASRKPRARVLLLGGIHGDELASVSVVFKWMEILDEHHSGLFHWRIMPALNPDGLLANKAQRVNANGVDLNRNFPTPNWSTEALIDYWEVQTGKDARRYPGERPLSEPESRWLVNEIERFEPDAIVSVHAPFGVVDFDGPTRPPDQIGRLHLNLLGIYPGSLGNFAGVQHAIPVLTVELPYAGIMPSPSEISAMWRDLVRWLYENIPAQDPTGAAADQESPS